ncbi:hypothetical protein BDZ89DRAFT_1130633 [Hymenopellis radicata]|nr:hypothetical protein BDZ89DRAFT_1130633 [Hymenopellis radicata]
MKAELPIGLKGWNHVGDLYNVWASDNDCPSREVKSLENKFKQLVRTSKPTGDAYCPPEIDRAHEIEELMNDKTNTRDLNNSDINSGDTEDSEIECLSQPDSEDETSAVKKAKAAAKPKPVVVKTEPEFIARRSAAPNHLSRPRTSRTEAQTLLTTISNALDPSVQAARDEERSARTFQTTQLLTLSNQLRDAQTQIAQLQSRLLDGERGRFAAE